MTKFKKQIGDYILEDQIGSGGFAHVVKGTHIPTGEKVAIKIMNKLQLMEDSENILRLKREISILKKVKHKNIIKLYEVMETPMNIYLIMEYCEGGELFDYIVHHKRLTEKQSCIFFKEIINALEYIHSLSISHRDIKPENMLLDKTCTNLTIKIIDFGISNFYEHNEILETPCGTSAYAPPEMHQGLKYSGLLSDVWSAGIVLYAMVYGYLPFCDENDEVNIQNILIGKYELVDNVSCEVRDLIKKCIEVDVTKRYNFNMIKQHPWFNMVKDTDVMKPGIIVGYHKIPIDERILCVCEELGYDKEKVRNCVMNNRYERNSSVYYITLRKLIENGFDSISDLFSKEYVDYINSKECLIEKSQTKEEEMRKEMDNIVNKEKIMSRNRNRNVEFSEKNDTNDKECLIKKKGKKDDLKNIEKIQINLIKRKRNNLGMERNELFNVNHNSFRESYPLGNTFFNCFVSFKKKDISNCKNKQIISKDKINKAKECFSKEEEKNNFSESETIDHNENKIIKTTVKKCVNTKNTKDHTIIHNRNASSFVNYENCSLSRSINKFNNQKENSNNKTSATKDNINTSLIKKKKLNNNIKGIMLKDNCNLNQSIYKDYQNSITVRMKCKKNASKRDNNSISKSPELSLRLSLNGLSNMKISSLYQKKKKDINLKVSSKTKPSTSNRTTIAISNKVKAIFSPSFCEVFEFPMFPKEKPRFYSGPINISFIIFMDICSLLEWLIENLRKNRIYFKKNSLYKYHCIKHKIMFNIEICTIDCNEKERDNIYYLLIQEKKGKLWSKKGNLLKEIVV